MSGSRHICSKENVRGFFEFRVCVHIGQKNSRKALRFLSLSLSFSLSLSLSLSFSLLIPAPIDSFLRSGHLRRFRGQSDGGHFFRRRLSKIARELPSS